MHCPHQLDPALAALLWPLRPLYLWLLPQQAFVEPGIKAGASTAMPQILQVREPRWFLFMFGFFLGGFLAGFPLKAVSHFPRRYHPIPQITGRNGPSLLYYSRFEGGRVGRVLIVRIVIRHVCPIHSRARPSGS